MTKEQRINVATSSTEGHFVEGAIKVVALDAVNETFHVTGKSKLVTKNHTDLLMGSECVITCQQVYNPFTKMLEKSKD